VVSPFSQNTLAICNKITLVILYYMNSRLVTLLKVIGASVEVSDILGLTFSFKFMNWLSYIPFLVPEMSTSFTSYIV